MPGILIVAEHLNGIIRDISMEMIGAAASIKEQFGGPVSVLVVSDNPSGLVPAVNLTGVDKVILVKAPGNHFDPHLTEEAAIKAGEDLKPGLILCGQTVNGMSLAAAIAARLGAGFASDVFGLKVEDGGIIATRGAYGNKVNLEVGFPGRGIVVLALRGATFIVPAGAGSAEVTEANVDFGAAVGAMTHESYIEAPPSNIDISKAEFILSVGRGIQEKENLPRFEALADKMGFTFGCSRPIVDAGWLPKPHQVGQSGKVASACKLYVALGISGAVQHLFGMKHIDTIIAVRPRRRRHMRLRECVRAAIARSAASRGGGIRRMTEPIETTYRSELSDESGLIGGAAEILHCQSVDALADALRRPQDAPVTVQGARTGVCGGAVPRGGLVLNLSRMDAILGFTGAGNDRLRVQAGAPLSRMEAEAGAAGRLFPADVTERTATAGGLFATGARGPAGFRLGQASAYVNALCWVTPRGDIWRFARGEFCFDQYGCALPDGTRFICRTDLPWRVSAFGLAKSGMDLIDFLAGSEGRLGIAAELEWVLPKPPAARWNVVYFFESEDTALRFADALRELVGTEQAGVWSAEFYDAETLRRLRDARSGNVALGALPPLPARANAAVQVELAGVEADVEELLEMHLARFAALDGRDEDTWAESGASAEKLRSLRHAVPEWISDWVISARAERIPAVRVETDFAGAPEWAVDYARMYRAGMEEAGLSGLVYGHVLENRLHTALLPRDGQEAEACEQLVRCWAARVVSDGGLLVGENGAGRVKRALVRAFLSPEALAQRAAVIRHFDPELRMSINAEEASL